jgi:hypothetical protein
MKVIRISSAITAVAVALPLALFGTTVAFATGGHDKVGICHRTNSDSNPFVYLEVPADEANGHITGTDKSHNDQGRWKSDGTWRGVTHKDGDEKHDYFAESKADCVDTPVGTTTTTGGTSSTTTTSSTTSTTPTETETSTTSTTSSATSSSPPVTTSSPTSSRPASQPPKPRKTTTPPSGTSSPTSGVATPRHSQPDTLAYTGMNAGQVWAAVVGLLLVGLGVMAIRAARRRKH